ncbi:MAG: hypothetical protein C4293_12785 [Nitrospiraceae bacterium]
MAKGPRTVQIAFGSPTLTHDGGVYLLYRFFTRIGLKHAFAEKLRGCQRNTRDPVGEMVLAVSYPMSLGLGRIETTQLLQHTGVFQYLTGLQHYPNPTTVRRFLLRAAPTALPKLRRLHDRVLALMTVRPYRPSRLIFDVDSTVLVLYGKHEKATIGYNPIKRGRPSDHPLLCFEGQSKNFWHGELRPGDAHTASGIRDVLTACFAKIPAGVRLVIVRADNGGVRPYAGRMARSPAGSLRARRPPDGSDQTQAGAPAVRESQPGHRGGRVPLSAHAVAPVLSLRRGATASARRADR